MPDVANGVWCFAVFVANVGDEPVHLEVWRSGVLFADTGFIRIPVGTGQAITYAPYDSIAGLPPGDVAILFLSHETTGVPEPHCPVSPAFDGKAWLHGTGRNQAFAIRTDRPVAAYSVFPYGSGQFADASASLLLPMSVWDTSYLAVNPYKMGDFLISEVGPPSLAILAQEEGTEVTVLPKVAIAGGPGVAPTQANVPMTYLLGPGEYVQFSQPDELTGSVIHANKPIGVWGTQGSVHIPSWAHAAETEHQQIPPLRAWGSRHAGVRYRNRLAAVEEEAPPWRLVGAVDGTTLSWVPSVPPGAPTTLNQGEVAEFYAPGPFVVESQDDDHPYYVAQYMTGYQYVEAPGSEIGEGDPEWVQVIPIDQYLERYVFYTDPTFSETSLVVLRRRSPMTGEFADVTLDCAGVLSGWEPLGDLEYTRLDLVTGDYEPVGGCNNGRHEMLSTAPFGVTVWGWGGYTTSVYTQTVSYAYPAAAGLAAINDVEVPPIPR